MVRSAKTAPSSSTQDTSRPREITRHVPHPIQCMLWGKAAGRCEFTDCNKPLWKSPVTQEQVNIAQKAHIYAFSADGPRGNADIPEESLNSLENLMLVCYDCHQKIDDKEDGGRYSAALLRRMKLDHEQRIERVSGIVPGKRSHVLLYGANVGEHSSPLNYPETAVALFPDRYPASDQPIKLGTLNSAFQERDAEFWSGEAKELLRKFERDVRRRIADGEVSHLSVFALAPQPLLVLLGTLLGDIVPADIYQRHREPPSWSWPQEAITPLFELREPKPQKGVPALVIGTSATVDVARVRAMVGPEASIWILTVPTPHNDVTKSREQLSQFRSLVRTVFDRIKALHGQTTTLHVFPVTSVSLAVEFGRIRMPKADMPLRMYDQVNAGGGFIPALSIPFGDH